MASMVIFVSSAKIWTMLVCAILCGICIGITTTFFLYDRWSFKRFKHNEEQWARIVAEQREIIAMYQNDTIPDGSRENINIDVK